MLSSWDCLIFVLYNLPFYSKCSKSQKQPNRWLNTTMRCWISFQMLPRWFEILGLCRIYWSKSCLCWMSSFEETTMAMKGCIYSAAIFLQAVVLKQFSAGTVSQEQPPRHHHTSTCLDPSRHILLQRGVGETAIQRSRLPENFVHRWQESTCVHTTVSRFREVQQPPAISDISILKEATRLMANQFSILLYHPAYQQVFARVTTTEWMITQFSKKKPIKISSMGNAPGEYQRCLN